MSRSFILAARPIRRRAGTAPTIRDVAKAAGVSPMTVSRVINRDQNVQPATRERVKTAIGALNYVPNAAARTLAGAVRTRIALLYGNPSAAYLSEVLVGSLEEASRSDVHLVLVKSDDGDIDKIVRQLVTQRLDGVILPPPFCDFTKLASALRTARMPTVALATASPHKEIFAVAIDDTEASREMTAHLIHLGHQRIGFIVGNANQTASAKRLDGYKLALEKAGIAYAPELVAKGDFTYRSGLRAAQKLLRAMPRPTAIFASNDDMAAAAVAAAHARHLEVPKDLSVCGFDDTALATTISPMLTTIRQPVAAMAQTAVAMLAAADHSRRQGGALEPEHKVFAYQLIRRKSDAPPPR